MEDQAGREGQCHPGAGAVPLGQEPGQARSHRQGPEAAAGSPCPRAEAGGDQAPAGQEPGAGGGRVVGEGVRRFATPDRQRHQAEHEASSQQREPNGAPERKSTGDHGPIVASAATGLKLQGRPSAPLAGCCR